LIIFREHDDLSKSIRQATLYRFLPHRAAGLNSILYLYMVTATRTSSGVDGLL